MRDLYSKCGGDGSTEDITIDYDLYLKLKVVGITVDPTISSSASFDCPISASDIEVGTYSMQRESCLTCRKYWADLCSACLFVDDRVGSTCCTDIDVDACLASIVVADGHAMISVVYITL